MAPSKKRKSAASTLTANGTSKRRKQPAASPQQGKPSGTQLEKSKASGFVDFMLQNYDVRHQICQELNTCDLLALANTTKKMQELKADRWDMDRHLQRFVDNPRALRSLQASTGSLLTGPSLLGFVKNCQSLREMDYAGLRVFTYPRHETQWLDLFSAEGYSVIDRHQNATVIIELSKAPLSTAESQEDARPSVILYLASNPISDILGGMGMTMAATIATWNKVYTLFPRQTLIRNIAAIFGDIISQTSDTMAWYKWPPSRVAGPWNHARFKDHFHKRGEFRHIGNASTFTISLDTTGINPPQHPFHIEFCEFWFGKLHGAQFCLLNTCAISNPMLRHGYTGMRYLSPEGEMQFGPMLTMQETYLSHLFGLNVLGLEEDERPDGVVSTVPATATGREHLQLAPIIRWEELKDWSPPEDYEWEYVDDLLPGWMNELKDRGTARDGKEIVKFGFQSPHGDMMWGIQACSR